MERADRATRDAILRKLFPGLGAGQDPEIGRYFRLRNEGRTAEALALFNRVLRSRYPDEGKRTTLFNLFRRSDPGFRDFHDKLLWELYDSVSARIRETLDSISRPASGISVKDTGKLLAALEVVARLLPEGRDAALARLDELSVLSGLLGYRAEETKKVRSLAPLYYDRESADSLDLSRVRLNARDVARIEIPADIERREDRALAFCFKYWKAVEDPAFERLVLLYSKKHGTPHHRIFKVIREGRSAGAADEEILGRVSAALSTGYSYTTQGDLYMRRAWKDLKARLEPDPGVTKLVKSAPPRAGGSPRRSAEKPRASGTIASKQISPRSPGAPKPINRIPRDTGPKPSRKRSAPAASSDRTAEASLAGPRGSVSDRIKSLSGRRYDVYREEFLARVGPAIRDWLSERRIKPKDVFEDPLGRAEDMIREFLEKNYSNPYMDWERSDTRVRVEGLGFSVPELDGIIALWYARRGA